MSDKEFYDLVYDVWMSGGNPDAVGRDRFEHEHDGEYDFVYDESVLNRELQRQKGDPR